MRRILLERGGGGGGEGFGLNDEGLVEEAEGLNTEAERLNPGAERLYPGAENLLVEQDEKVYYSARSDLDLHITNKVRVATHTIVLIGKLRRKEVNIIRLNKQCIFLIFFLLVAIYTPPPPPLYLN